MHVLNCSPSSALKDITPYEAWFNHKPSVSHFWVFGSQAYVHIQKKHQHSFKSKSRKCIFVGYPPDFKGWKVYDPLTHQITVSRDVIFDENTMPGSKHTSSDTPYSPLHKEPVSESGGEHSTLYFRPSNSDSLLRLTLMCSTMRM